MRIMVVYLTSVFLFDAPAFICNDIKEESKNARMNLQ